MAIPSTKGRLILEDSGGVNPFATYELETRAKPTYAPEGCTFPQASYVEEGVDWEVSTTPEVITDPETMELKLINLELVE